MKKRITLIVSIGLLLCLTEVKGQSTYLSIPDTRNTTTLPTDYNLKLKSEFKRADIMGLPNGGYAYILGLRGSSEDSGGPAHELAFSPSKLFLRSGTNAGGWQAWRELLIANTAGNFGIGTENPDEKLEIANGYLKSGHTSFGNYLNSSAKNYNTFGSDKHGSLIMGSNVFIESYTNIETSTMRNAMAHPTMAGTAIVFPGNNLVNQGSIIFHTSSPAVTQADKPFDSPRMIINATGNVGIGTISPQELLSVKGNIRAHQIKVETSNWPDYVFKDDYQLPSLAETEKFIQTNGHLPDVPKAEVIHKEGYSLNEMDKILLKKIEEMTLYMIDKDKRIQALEETIKKLNIK